MESLSSFWIYQAQDIQRFIEFNEEIYDRPVYESLKEDI